jgi:large conductance mechanosensitive channel
MPPFGLITGKVDFKDKYINLSGQEFASLDAAKKAGAATLNYGAFINIIIEFLIVGFAVFLLVKWINKMKRFGKDEEEPAAPSTKECPFCLTKIPLKAVRCSACTSEIR